MSTESGGNQGRREFFHRSLARLIRPVGDFLEKRFPFPAGSTILRPPGALPEQDFLDLCARCGACVDSCPVDAILPWDSGNEATDKTPIIDPNVTACVVCDGLECMNACPTGALRLVDAPEDIRMGLARVAAADCVRAQDDDCSICVDRCPMGSRALNLPDDGPPHVIDDGCIGCGVCQKFCPTRPTRAIVVIPHRRNGPKADPQA